MGHAVDYGEGEVRYVTGMSGVELAIKVLEECKIPVPSEIRDIPGYSPEYWVGWVYAYYQWYSGLAYKEIFAAIPYEDVYRMYWPIHEADISKAVSLMDEIRKECS